MARPAIRQGRRRPRRPTSTTAAAIPDITSMGRWVLRPQVIGTALVVLAAALLPTLLPLAGVVGEARNGVVRLFGLHVFTLLLIIASGGALLLFRRTGWLHGHTRHAIGAFFLAVFIAGALGRWYPHTAVSATSLAQHSAGGEAGRWLTSTRALTGGWLLTLPVSFTLLWPLTARRIAARIPHMLAITLALTLSATRAGFRRAHAAWRTRSRRAASEAALAAAAPAIAMPQTLISDELDTPLPTPVFDDDDALPEGGVEEPDDAPAEGPGRGRGRGRRHLRMVPPGPAVQIAMDMERPADELRHSRDGWQLPPLTLLGSGAARENATADNAARADLIVQTLASFGVDARVIEINEGPTVTQFGVEPGWDVRTRTVVERDASGNTILDARGDARTRETEVSRTRIRVNRITALQNDLALALAAPALRIEAPVPGKPIVGIEVPNASVGTVTLRDVMETPTFQRGAAKAALPFALGTGVAGVPVIADLARMPHLLIAGATGSGKSVCLNAIITGFLMHFSPEDLRLVLIDPKRVELTAYGNMPHLAFSHIIVEMDEVVGTLQAVINEMESRYRRFAHEGVRNIEAYNAKAADAPAMRRLPYWVVVIDELADLMLVAPVQVENQLVRLAQLARATGIHLIVATQRPSVDVVTGLIKANFPTRIAFAVASQVDSRTVLDQSGAEKLLGRGDMLYVPTDAQKPTRLQGVYVSDAEIQAVVDFWAHERFRALAPEKHDELLQEAKLEVASIIEQQQEQAEADDPMLQKALELARQQDHLSTSLLQRRLRIGYPRAARIMDELEARGVVGQAEGAGGSRPVIGNGTIPGVTPLFAPSIDDA